MPGISCYFILHASARRSRQQVALEVGCAVGAAAPTSQRHQSALTTPTKLQVPTPARAREITHLMHAAPPLTTSARARHAPRASCARYASWLCNTSMGYTRFTRGGGGGGGGEPWQQIAGIYYPAPDMRAANLVY